MIKINKEDLLKMLLTKKYYAVRFGTASVGNEVEFVNNLKNEDKVIVWDLLQPEAIQSFDVPIKGTFAISGNLGNGEGLVILANGLEDAKRTIARYTQKFLESGELFYFKGLHWVNAQDRTYIVDEEEQHVRNDC